ncbi:23S rRNA (guanosine(2251)-2'-O)-methyltransferase RlmB [Bacteroidota bacterium]
MKKTENLIYGIRAVIEAINSGKNLDKLFIKKGLQGELIQELYAVIKLHQIHYQHVPIEKINKITRKNHQGVVGYLSLIDYYSLENTIISLFESGKNPFILILDQISDVRNFGAICRVAECAGVDAIIIPEIGSAQINSDALKTSAGALNYIKICKSKNLENSIKYLKNSGLKIFAATEKASDLYYNQNYSDPCAIIFGSEDLGISNRVLQLADEMVKIPILGNINSLNVSSAVSIIIYEAVKQRKL